MFNTPIVPETMILENIRPVEINKFRVIIEPPDDEITCKSVKICTMERKTESEPPFLGQLPVLVLVCLVKVPPHLQAKQAAAYWLTKRQIMARLANRRAPTSRRLFASSFGLPLEFLNKN
jgi:hypothetical protein